MKKIKRLLLWLFILFTLYNIFTIIHAYKMTRFGTKPQTAVMRPEDLSFLTKVKYLLLGVPLYKPVNKGTPSDAGLKYETLYVTNRYGLKLEIWLVKNRTTKFIQLHHGFKDRKYTLLNQGKELYDMGYNLVFVDFTGSGGSEGNYCTVGYKESHDVFAVYKYIQETYKPEEHVLFGQSMGAAAVAKSFYDHKIVVDKVILEAPFASLLKTVKKRFKAMSVPSFPSAQLLTFWGGVLNGFNAFSYDISRYAGSVDVPVLLLCGGSDSRIDKGDIMAIYENMPGPKTVYFFENAGHQDLLKYDRETWLEKIELFL